MDVQTLIRTLDLEPHPEGGWFREVYRSSSFLDLSRGPRSTCTVIHYVLVAGAFSALHRVASDEVWSWIDGDALELSLLTPAGGHQPVVLGRDLVAGQRPVAVVPAGVWQGARTLGDGHAWCTCTVAPGFEFDDFELGRRAELLAAFPEHADVVERLTHP